MTRRSKRELERALDDLDGSEGSAGALVVWKDERTGEFVDANGDPADPDPDAHLIVMREHVITSRKRAEEQGLEILGPAEDTPPERDLVRVPEGRHDAPVETGTRAAPRSRH